MTKKRGPKPKDAAYLPRLYNATRDAARLKAVGLWPQFKLLKAKYIAMPRGVEQAFRDLVPELNRLEEEQGIEPDRVVPGWWSQGIEPDVEVALRGKEAPPEVNLAWALDAVGRRKAGEKIDPCQAPSLKALTLLAMAEAP